MPFTTGKIGFTAYCLHGECKFPNWDEIQERIKEKSFKPLDPEKTESICFVDPSAEIEEDFKKPYRNWGSRTKILIDVLQQVRIPNAAILKRRIKDKLKLETERMKREYKDWKPDKEWKSEIKAGVVEEETLKADPTFKRCQFCLDLDEGLVYIASSSQSAVGVVEGALGIILKGQLVVMVPDLFTSVEKHGLSKLQPFGLLTIHSNHPEDIEQYGREWLTWMFIKNDIQGCIEDFAEVFYYAGDCVKGSLRTNNSSEPLSEFVFREIYEGGLVNQFSLNLPYNIFDPKATGFQTHMKVDKRGFISEIDSKMKAAERLDGTAIVLDGVARAYEDIKKQAEAFFEIRKKDFAKYIQTVREMFDHISHVIPPPADIKEGFSDDSDECD